MCAGARATGSRARSGLRGDRDAVSLRGKTPRADPLARRDFPPLHVAPATVFVRPEHDPVSGLFNGLQGGKVSLQLPSCPHLEHDDGLRSQQAWPPIPVVRKAIHLCSRISGVQSRLSSQKGGQLGSYATLSFLRLVNRSRARPAARPCTTSCGFESSGTIPFPGADSIFSSLCGAISGRLPFCRQVLSRRDPDDRNASVQKSTIGSAVSSGTAVQEHI